jgi:hypothetical protein
MAENTQAANVAAPVNANGMAALLMEVNKKVAGKYDKVGEVTLHVPLLHTVFTEAKIAKDDKGNEVYEDGLPVYEKDEHNWIQGAILALAKAQARNKLVSGTATLKAGKTIANDWAGIMAEGERVGNPEALAAIREAKADFAKWVATLGKSEGAQQTLITLFGNKAALGLQNTANKGKMVGYIEQFAATLDDAKTARYTKHLESLLAIAEAGEDVNDF